MKPSSESGMTKPRARRPGGCLLRRKGHSIILRTHPNVLPRNRTVPERPRILILEGTTPPADWPPSSDWDVVPVPDLGDGLARLGRESFHAVVLAPGADGLPAVPGQAELILNALDDGVAILEPESRVVWCNAVFRGW